MALRTRLFLFFGGLVSSLVTAELWLVNTLVEDLEQEVGKVALDVGSGVMNFMGARTTRAPWTVDLETAEPELHEDLEFGYFTGALVAPPEPGTEPSSGAFFVAPVALAHEESAVEEHRFGLHRFLLEPPDEPRVQRIRDRELERTLRERARAMDRAGAAELDRFEELDFAARVLAEEAAALEAELAHTPPAFLTSIEVADANLLETLDRVEHMQAEVASELEIAAATSGAVHRVVLRMHVEHEDLFASHDEGGFLEFEVPGDEHGEVYWHELRELELAAEDLLTSYDEEAFLEFDVPGDEQGEAYWHELRELELAADAAADPRDGGRSRLLVETDRDHALDWPDPDAPALLTGTERGPVASAPRIYTTASVTPGPPAAAPPPAASPSPVARIPFRREGFVDAIERFLRRLLLGSGAILGIGLLVAGFGAHRVATPLRGLAEAAQSVGDGHLGTQAPSRGDGEVRQTIDAFNAMSVQLETLDREASRLREREHLTELGEVARGVAHSLRNPLNTLGLLVDEMASRSQDSDELAGAARAQIQRADRAVRTLLSLTGTGGATSQAVDLGELARDVALELVQDAGGRAAVQVDVLASTPLLRGVAPELRAVLHVLVVNAVEASPDGSVVHVTIDRSGSHLEVRIEDAGSGISPLVAGRLFQPHTTTKEQGAGMGLYLARRIAATRYGGSLTLEGRPAGGAVATLRVGDLAQSEGVPRG